MFKVLDKLHMEKCKCGKEISINVGDHIQDGKYLWYASSHCEYCGKAYEMDGYGIFDTPYDIQQEIINRDGEWLIIARGSTTVDVDVPPNYVHDGFFCEKCNDWVVFTAIPKEDDMPIL